MNLYNGRSTEFRVPGWFRVYTPGGQLVASSQWLIDAEDDLRAIGAGSIVFVAEGTGRRTLVGTEANIHGY